jgi:PAS domain S-box-containing protein
VNKTNVLIVEDDRSIAGNLADSLTALGHTVSGIAASGEEALRRVEENPPDLALLDIKLRGEMDGVDVARAIRARFDIPVVYLTAYHDDALVKRAADTEPQGFILKPYEIHELKSTIGIAVHKHAMERRLRESEARYRSLVESSVQALVVIEGGPPPRMVMANPPCAALTGYAVEELVSLPSEQLAALIHPQDLPWIKVKVDDYFAGRPVPPSGELRIVRRDGAERWVEYHSSLVEYGDRPAIQAAFVDITDRKQAAKALRKAHDELEQRVADRTAELVRANTLLEEEIATRIASEGKLQRRNRELQMLHHSTLELSSSLDLDHVVTMVLTEVRHLLDASGCTLWLLDQEEGQLRCWQAVGPHSHLLIGLQVPLGKGLVGWVAQNHESLLVPDTRTDDRHFKRVDRSIGVETRCILSVPLKVKEKFIGVVQVVGEEPACFDRDDLTLLEPLASSAAIAIDNARLYDETKRSEIALRNRHRELALLNRVIAASAASLAIDPILSVVCRELAVAFDVPHSAAVLLDDDRTRAVVVASHHANGGATGLGTTIAVERDPTIRYLVEHKAPLALNGPQTATVPPPNGSLLHLADAVSTLAIPLVLDGEVLGAVGMSATQVRPFSTKEVELAQRVAEQISGALARARLTKTQRQLSAAVEQAAEAVLITDAEGTILYVNPAFEQTTGYSRAEAIGQNPRILKSGQQHGAFYHKMWEKITAGLKWQGRLVNRRKDGTRFLADEIIAPVHNQAGDITAYVATMRDVTLMVELEQQIHHGQKMESLGRLAGSIAHDFGNLLTVVESGAAVLLLQMDPEDSRRKQVEQIQKTGERGKELTRQLLRFSRRETTKPGILDLNRVIDDLAWTLERLLGTDIQVSTLLAEDLWPIHIGTSQMEQVIMNLVINARDAMPEGGTVTIETSNLTLEEVAAGCGLEDGTNEGVQLIIRDTGVGMDDEVRARLFEPFFTTKAPGQGTGLGLSTVFSIIQQSGGHIRVDSKPGQGATFVICFPAARRKPQELPPGSPASGADRSFWPS